MASGEAGSLEERVTGLIVEQLGVSAEEARLQASFTEDLGADSLDIVELVMSFEESFDIEIPDEDVDTVNTVGDCVKLIVDKAS